VRGFTFSQLGFADSATRKVLEQIGVLEPRKLGGCVSALQASVEPCEVGSCSGMNCFDCMSSQLFFSNFLLPHSDLSPYVRLAMALEKVRRCDSSKHNFASFRLLQPHADLQDLFQRDSI
jgi:hypothetical protein